MSTMTAFVTPEVTKTYEPTDWQVEDIDDLSTRDWSANWSEMGCYKTTTGLWLMQKKLENVANPKVLIITTKAGKGTYFDAIPVVLPDWVLFNIHATGRAELNVNGQFLKVDIEKVFDKTIVNKPTVYVAHYHCFTNKSKVRELFQKHRWDFILLDEAHRIKERSTQWTRNIKKLKAPYRHIMTGTGFINNPAEIWSLLNFLEPYIFSSYTKFKEVFCEIDDWSGYEKIVGILPGMEEEFRKMIYSFGVRRERNGPKGVFEGKLHRPIFSNIQVELNTTQRRMYDEIKGMLYTLDKKGEPIHSPNVLSMLNRLRQICVATPEKIADYYDEKLDRRVQKVQLTEPSSKLDAVMEILEGMEWDEEKKQQVVIFSNFKDPLNLLAKRFDAMDDPIPYLHMKAEMSEDERYRLWHDLWPTKQHRVFMATLALGSESINLSSADTAIFLDRSWSPKDNEQGISRIYRPPQTAVPHIIHINAKNTTDQYVESVNATKMGWFRDIFGQNGD